MIVKKILTIAIPTIDGEKGLNRLLKSIYENLKDINEYEFLVSISIGINGGKSPIPYVKEILNKIKGLEIVKEINYEYRPLNIKFSSNLVHLYSTSEEGFVWFIGDDDVVLEGSINYIINELKKIVANNYKLSSIPPIYLNWCLDEKLLINYSKPSYKTIDQFCKYEQSIFFLSAMIVYKHKNSYMHGIEHFSHLWIFLTQALNSKKVLLISRPIIKYTANCRCKKEWLDIMFYYLPNTLLSLKNLGLPQKSINSITKTSLENRTTIYTTLFLANKQTLSEKFFSIASVIKHNKFFTTKFKFLIITAILISPLYHPLNWIKRSLLKKYL